MEKEEEEEWEEEEKQQLGRENDTWRVPDTWKEINNLCR